MAEPLLVALGGHALAPPGAAPPFAAVRACIAAAAGALVPLVTRGHALVVTHGNGPQVGHALERAHAAHGRAYALPLDACVAQTQGEIGYLLAEALEQALARAGHARAAVALVTRVAVDAHDPRLATPEKPVGPVYPADPDRGFPVRAVPGGVRRVVPSPRPLRVLETEAIRALLAQGALVIAAGGGGIAVDERGGPVRGLEAVVDKDLTSAVLAADLGLARMLNLTGVERVRLGFGTAREREVERLDLKEARRLLAAGEFAPGSMGPKVEGAIRFLERGGRRVDVGLVARALEVLDGRAGTRIVARDDGGDA